MESCGGVQSHTLQNLESATDDSNMHGPIFAMLLQLAGRHPEFRLIEKHSSETGYA